MLRAHPQFSIPNALSVLRILLVPVLVGALLQDSDAGDVVAAALFLLATATDIADGVLARASGAVTALGKSLDPLADKLLVVATLVCLVALDRLAVWIVAIIVVREVAVTIARSRADAPIAATGWGKAKTASQIVALVALILVDPAPWWVDVLVGVMVALTVASGIAFFVALRAARAAQAAPSSHSRTES